MHIVPFKAEHLAALALQPAQALSLQDTGDDYGPALEAGGNGYTAIVDGRPVACAGIVEQWRGRGLAWALLAGDIGPHCFVRVTRAVRRALDLSPLRRVEAHVDVRFNQGIRWARMLGFEAESVMRSFTPDGGDAFMYVRIR